LPTCGFGLHESQQGKFILSDYFVHLRGHWLGQQGLGAKNKSAYSTPNAFLLGKLIQLPIPFYP